MVVGVGVVLGVKQEYSDQKLNPYHRDLATKLLLDHRLWFNKNLSLERSVEVW